MRAIESQLIQKFVHDQEIQLLQQQENFTDFETILKGNDTPVLSFANLTEAEHVTKHMHSTRCLVEEFHDIYTNKLYVKPHLPYSTRKVSDNADLMSLQKV